MVKKYYTPKTRSGRSYGAFAGKSTGRGRSRTPRNPFNSPAIKRGFSSLKKRNPMAIAAGVAGAANAAGAVAEAYGAIKRNFGTQTGSSKVSSLGSRSGQLAGKIKGQGKAINRKTYKDKKLSSYGYAQKGICYREEFREQDAAGQINESRVIGHTSLPIRATYYNIWRAVLKTLFVRAGALVDNLTYTSKNQAGTSEIVLYYTSSWTSNTTLAKVYTPGNNVTWQQMFDGFADWVLGQFEEDPKVIRFQELEYKPATGGYAANDYNRTRLNLAQAKIHVKSKSMLKFQNQSSTAGATGQEDDVTNIPIECHTYYVVGNQFIHMNKKNSLTPAYGFLGFSNTYLKNEVGAEPMPAYEYVNCVGKEKTHLDPGHIKTSIISHSGVWNFREILMYCVELVNSGGTPRFWKFADDSYVKRFGHCRAIHCDRVIGSSDNLTANNAVRLMIELELQQKVACIGMFNTATDQYEKQN